MSEHQDYQDKNPEPKVIAKVRQRSKASVDVGVATDTDTPFMVFIDKVSAAALITLAVIALGTVFIVF